MKLYCYECKKVLSLNDGSAKEEKVSWSRRGVCWKCSNCGEFVSWKNDTELKKLTK